MALNWSHKGKNRYKQVHIIYDGPESYEYQGQCYTNNFIARLHGQCDHLHQDGKHGGQALDLEVTIHVPERICPFSHDQYNPQVAGKNFS